MTKKVTGKLSVDLKTHGSTKDNLNEFLELSRRSPTDVTVEALDRLINAELPLLREIKKMKSNGAKEPENTLGNQIADLKVPQKQGPSAGDIAVAKKKLEAEKAKNKRKGGK